MLSIAIDAFAGTAFFAADVARFSDWVKASPPRDPTQPVMLPGEIEARTRPDREANGIPIDATTRADF